MKVHPGAFFEYEYMVARWATHQPVRGHAAFFFTKLLPVRPMPQSRRLSLLEAVTNVVVGAAPRCAEFLNAGDNLCRHAGGNLYTVPLPGSFCEVIGRPNRFFSADEITPRAVCGNHAVAATISLMDAPSGRCSISIT